MAEDQQFCLRWNNFQSYITSQFESLRDEEDFVDVTLACGGQRLGAHKVVLSACSPFFKELFKANPCPHPIIFMRDVEVQHVVSLLEFMYAGEVNVAQANLSGFLRTAESLQIRGLTDAARPVDDKTRVTSTQGVGASSDVTEPKREETINPFAVNQLHSELELVEPKLELPDYSEDEASREDKYMDVDGTAAAVLSVGDSTPGTSAPVDIHHTHDRTEAQESPSQREHHLKETYERDKTNRKIRKRCRRCYNKLLTMFNRSVAQNKCKKVSTFCIDCPGKPFLCIDCFNKHSLPP